MAFDRMGGGRREQRRPTREDYERFSKRDRLNLFAFLLALLSVLGAIGAYQDATTEDQGYVEHVAR